MEISTIKLNNELFITLKGREYRQIKLSDIVSIHTSGKYTTITTINSTFCICTSLKSIAKHLTSFIVITNSHIINRYYISRIVKDVDTYLLVLTDGFTIELSRYLAKRVIEQL